MPNRLFGILKFLKFKKDLLFASCEFVLEGLLALLVLFLVVVDLGLTLDAGPEEVFDVIENKLVYSLEALAELALDYLPVHDGLDFGSLYRARVTTQMLLLRWRDMNSSSSAIFLSLMKSLKRLLLLTMCAMNISTSLSEQFSSPSLISVLVSLREARGLMINLAEPCLVWALWF